MKLFSTRLTTFLLFIGIHFFSQATLEVVVLKGVKDTIPIAVLPFYLKNSDEQIGIASIIGNDLTRSGYFQALPQHAIKNEKETAGQVNFKKWQQLGAEILIFGQVESQEKHFLSISVYVYEVYSAQAILAYKYRVLKQAKRRVAHQISDKIYQSVLGIKGDFDSYLTYIEVNKTTQGRQYHIKITDSDGKNDRVLFSSSEPLLSPTWSYDNQKIAYVSFENGRSEIFIRYPFLRKNVQKLPFFNGIASAPSWHPDGDKILFTLSKDGNKDIYLYYLRSERLERLTQDKDIDTEANFSSDGNKIVFTSNRSGKPQIYLLDLNTKSIKRLSFHGNYNASANFSPDGRYVVMLNGNKGQYHIALLDLSNDEWTLMTQNILDESPDFSPNGQSIIYTTNSGKKSVLSVLSIDGLRAYQLLSSNTQIRDPDWSNFLAQ